MDVNISVPEDLYKQALEIAEAQKVSVDEVFASAFAEQLAARASLRRRAARGVRDKFLAVLENAPDIEPEEYDRI